MRMEQEEKLEQAERKQREQQMKNPLEPLLLKLAREFSDSEDLSDRLRCLYEVSASTVYGSKTLRGTTILHLSGLCHFNS